MPHEGDPGRTKKVPRSLAARYETILATVPEIIIEIDTDEVCTWANEKGKQFFGEDVIGKELSCYFEDRRQSYEITRPCFESAGGTACIETRQRRKNGEERLLAWWCRPLRDARGNATGAVLTARDVSDLRRSQKSVHEMEMGYKAILEAAVEGILVADIETRQFRYANLAICGMLGYSEKELRQMSVADIHPNESLDHVIAEFEAQARGEKSLASAIPCLRKDGMVFYADINTSLAVIDGRECNVGFFADLTESRSAGTRLRESKEDFSDLTGSIADVFFAMDADFRYTYWNKAAVDLTHISAKDAIGKSLYELFPDIRGTKSEELYLDVQRTRRAKATLDEYELHGKTFAFELSAYPSSDGIAVLTKDITERRNLEEQLRQSQKMEAVGQLAGGIAHDFNNLLTVITGYGEMLLRKTLEDAEAHKRLEAIVQAGKRAADLTRQLLVFGRKQTLQPRVLNLTDVVGNVLKMLPRLIGEDIVITLQLEPELEYVLADPVAVEQIVMNLATNARDAMPHGGGLVIATANAAFSEVRSEIPPDAQPGGYVMLSVQDNGSGMDLETQERVFEPFFTTKEKGKGTGLGLSTVYGIVKQSGGHITVKSEPGRGTTFTVYLPTVEEAVELKAEVTEDEPVLEGSGTILVVEDEEGIRELSIEVLSDCGYTVLQARDADEALEVCRKHKGAIDLVLTDVVMPGMSGKGLADPLARDHPSMKVIYMSGYSDGVMAQRGVSNSGVQLIQKPFTPASLSREVRKAIGEPPGKA
ncbi:MAG: PAS domain S-box protein [Planctomycetes bacterium]|nr:PAS domain S-box protein [Planctomycetota bacterium]